MGAKFKRGQPRKNLRLFQIPRANFSPLLFNSPTDLLFLADDASGLMRDRRKKFVAKLFHAEPRQCRVEAIEVFAVIAKFPARLGQAFGFKAALGLLAV